MTKYAISSHTIHPIWMAWNLIPNGLDVKHIYFPTTIFIQLIDSTKINIFHYVSGWDPLCLHFS